ncbi:hypothetical protein [Caulobacter endophyticus]|uniref:hypothetical protein n=1 Tax=Caulobacter endophyticus TaxID=2172652 RepID=UPI00240EBE09|nr:hypothetical protein [Caulobacter endophyticus]MDG2530769.1 hypothetical protein [Caulobacter endophyticus]
MRWSGAVFAAAASTMLSGCALVVSEGPWFGPDDARGAPELRQGLWVDAAGEACRPQADRPLRLWRGCDILLIRGAEYLALERRKERWTWAPQTVLLAGGDPAVLQWRVNQNEGSPNTYAGVEPTNFDAEGRVTALYFWAVTCEQHVAAGGDGKRPLHPGLKRRDSNGECEAESREALFAAAKVGKPSRDQAANAWRWIREARPDDFAPTPR